MRPHVMDRDIMLLYYIIIILCYGLYLLRTTSSPEASLTGSLITQRLIVNCFKKPSIKSSLNAQQFRDLAQKAYGKQKMASEKSAKPDLNRGMTAGMDHVDVSAHLDDTGISHGTNQGLMRVNGRDRGTSEARLETQERKAHGNSMKTPRENDKLTLEQPAQGIDEKIHKDSKLTKLKLNPHKNKRHHHISTHYS